MSAAARFHLLRHAPVVNPGGAIYGRNEVGVDLSDEDALAALAREAPAGAVWVVSPLSRARATAAAIRARMPNGVDEAEPIVENDLVEQDFGGWCGLTHDEIRARDPQGADRFWAAPADAAPPDGESFARVVARVGPALDRLGELHVGREIIVATHGGVIRAAVAHALGVAPDRVLALVVDTLSTTRIDRFVDGSWRIVGVNLPPRRGVAARKVTAP